MNKQVQNNIKLKIAGVFILILMGLWQIMWLFIAGFFCFFVYILGRELLNFNLEVWPGILIAVFSIIGSVVWYKLADFTWTLSKYVWREGIMQNPKGDTVQRSEVEKLNGGRVT